MIKAHSEVLGELSAADEFFARVGAQCPPQIIPLARRYTRRRMRSTLSRTALSGLSPTAARALCRAHLEQAYAEFIAWMPVAEQAARVEH